MTTGSVIDRSATGATLSASFTGATGTISRTGFKYGTTSGNLIYDVSTTSSVSPFTGTLSGLTAGTKYYYKAYVVEYNASTQANEYRYSTEASFTTKTVATATVTTGQVTNLGATTATFNGSFSGATGTISDHGFWYKKSSDSQWQIAHLNGTNTQGSFTANVSGLSESTTYIVKAWVEEYDEASGQYVDRFGAEITFTTPASSSISTAYLNDYGMPDVSSIVTNLGTTGSNDRDDHWYRYNTTSNTRQIAIHTYTHPSSHEETMNYVVLYDGSNYAPLWTAHTMNQSLWPDNGVGRYDDWTNDPAISLTQQSGLDNASTVGYSRGHLVASEYRQTTVKQNKQTFYYSNQAPQWQNGFNGGVWNALENRVRAAAPTESTMMYVVTGVLYEYDGSPTTLKSGSLNVPIPTHFYKCIMQCTFNGTTVTSAKGIAFVYTNQSHSNATSYYGTDGSESFVTSIDAIEQRAGFDFFAKVPDNLEAAAEANTNHTWFTGKS